MVCFGNWVDGCFSFWFLLLTVVIHSIIQSVLNTRFNPSNRLLQQPVFSGKFQVSRFFCELAGVNRTPS